MAMKISQVQRAAQTQVQRMSAKQIQTMKLLSLGTADLRREIYEEVQKNPALELEDDSYSMQYSKRDYSGTHEGYATSSGEEKSQAYQESLERIVDNRRSLSDALLEQLSLLKLSEKQESLCTRLIHNLDEHGYFVLAPFSLLKEDEDKKLLSECLKILRGFEPVGIFCSNIEESLLIQAEAQGQATPLVRFILSGRLDFLNPPAPEKVKRKLLAFYKEKQSLAFSNEDFSFLKELSDSQIEQAVLTIKALDPYPARNYSVEDAPYIVPDLYVDGTSDFTVRLAKDTLPRVVLSRDAMELKKAGMGEIVTGAQGFLDSLMYRKNALLECGILLTQLQKSFFKDGPGNIVPLRQSDVAKSLRVHEATVSRIANDKYLQCKWGLFPIKYFFSNSIAAPKPAGLVQEVARADGTIRTDPQMPEDNGMPVADTSREKVLFEIKKILEEHKNDKKALSDQKISDALSERGIRIARRTVAKYRSLISVDSSYNR